MEQSNTTAISGGTSKHPTELHSGPHSESVAELLHVGEISNGLHLHEVAQALHLKQLQDAIKQKSVPKHGSSIWYYMGGLTMFFIVIQVVSGLMLLVYFEPTTQLALKSTAMLENQVPYGWLVRSLHSWTAHAVLLMTLLHMFSAYFMKAYRPPREILWVSGVALFAIVMGMGYTGYLLPELSGKTLRQFFALHVGVLPGLLAVLGVLHVVTAGFIGSSTPIGAKVKKRILFFPNYVMSELVVWLVAFAAIFTLSWVMPVAMSAVTSVGPKFTATQWIRPEWFFLFLSQTFRYLSGWIGNSFVLVLFLGWLSIPWLDRRSRKNEKSRAFNYIGIAIILYMTIMTTLGYMTIAQEKDAPKTEQTPPTK